MPILRRYFARLLFPLTALLVQAQSVSLPGGPGDKITLNDAIQRALAKNFSIQVDRYDAEIASARVTEALGKFDPVLSGRYNYSESSNPALIDASTGARPAPSFSQADEVNVGVGGVLPWGMTYLVGANGTNSLGTLNAYQDNFKTFAGVSGVQPLLRNFGFTPTLASIRIAQANRGISQWQFQQSVMDTITNVIFAYNNLNFAYASLRTATRSRDLAAQLLSENEKRYKVGSVSEFDVTSARSRTASREEGILFAERGVLVAENALKQLISDTQTPELLGRHLEIEETGPAPIVVVDAVADFRLALEKRPDYQQAKLAVERDSVNSRLQRNQLLPRVDLVGSYGHNGYDTDQGIARRQVQDEEYRAYSWGVVVSVPLTFTTERGRYRAARLQKQQSETTLAQVEQNIVVLIGNAAGQVETAQKRIHATRLARELAQATLDAEARRFRAGQSSTFFVSQQQEILTEAEIREALAQSDYHKALAEYDRQLGVTLDKLNVKLELPKS